MAAKLVVLARWSMFQDYFPNVHAAGHSVHQDFFGVLIVGGKEGGILGKKVVEYRDVAATCGLADQVLSWIEGWMGVENILGVVFGYQVTGKEVGSCLRGAILCNLGEELAVLSLEDSAKSGEIIGGDSFEKRLTYGLFEGEIRFQVDLWFSCMRFVRRKESRKKSVPHAHRE